MQHDYLIKTRHSVVACKHGKAGRAIIRRSTPRARARRSLFKQVRWNPTDGSRVLR